MQENFKKLLMEEEGLRLKPYRCTKNKLTIGFGRNLDAKGISVEEAKIMLENDLKYVEEKLSKYDFWNNIDKNRRDVLSNMAFQLGVEGLLQFTNFIKYIVQKDYKNASEEMLDSKWAREDTPSRAKYLSKIIETGILDG